MASDIGIAIATLALALCLANDLNSLWLIYAALTVRSIGAGIQTPAVAALIPQIVPEDQLLRINGLFGSVQSMMTLGAPIIAAGLYATWGLEATLFLDVVTAIIGVGLLAKIPLTKVDRSAEGEPVDYFTDLRAGLAYVWHTPVIRWLITYMGVVMLLAVPPSILTPLMVARTFGPEVWRLTANELAFGVGMVAAGILVAIFASKFINRLKLVALGTLTLGFATIAMGTSTVFWVFLAFMFVCGLAVPFLSTPMFTIFQETIDPAKQGRVFGVMSIVMALSKSCSSSGVRSPCWLVCGACRVQGDWSTTSALRSPRQLASQNNLRTDPSPTACALTALTRAGWWSTRRCAGVRE